jgi:small GTP-binding protein
MFMQKKTVKCTMIGDSCVGKSSIIERIINATFLDNKETTLGACYHQTKELINGISTELQYWDTAGQERYNSLIPMYLRNADIVILVFDLSFVNSIESVKKWKKMTDQMLSSKNSKLIILGNKLDLSNLVNKKKIQDILSSIQYDYYLEVSAKKNTNINTVKRYIKLISENIEPTHNTNIIIEKLHPHTKKKCC